MDRTVKVELHPTPEQAQALHETMGQFTYAFNHVVAYGWQNREQNKSCGYCLNADYNASINIKQKYLASVGTSFTSASPSTGVLSQSSD
jgi:hypothetical protein